MDNTRPCFPIVHYKRHMENPSVWTMPKKHKIAGLGFFYRDFYAFQRLCTGAHREGNPEVFHDEMGKSGAVKTHLGIAAGIAIRKAKIFLGIFDNLFPEIPFTLNISSNMAWCKYGTS